jgi:hypothetical protein
MLRVSLLVAVGCLVAFGRDACAEVLGSPVSSGSRTRLIAEVEVERSSSEQELQLSGSLLHNNPGLETPYEDGCLQSEACGYGTYCGACGCGGCDMSCCCDSCRLLGVIAHRDCCFDRFISPQSNPLFFEDPRTLTELRVHVVHHNIPGDQPVLLGGEARFFAVQARAALTERLSIIATKDGYIDLDTNNPALGDPDGWADVTAGLKYNLLRDPCSQSLVSAGLTYEIPLGTNKVLQGYSDGEFHAFLTGGTLLLPNAHWLSGTGFRLPVNDSDRSQMWYWSNHFDYEFRPGWYAVYEVNWFHWLKSGNGDLGTSGFEGNDLFNLGSTNVAGNDIVTMAVGARYKPRANMELGAAYEFPATERRDLLQDRIYFDMIVRY